MKLPLQLGELRAELGRAQREAERLTAGLSDSQFWQGPPDGGWSVGECLVHLCLVGEPYPKLRATVADARIKGRTGQEPFELGFLGERFVRSQTADGRKVGTSRVFEPKRDPEVVARFNRLQDALFALSVEAGAST